jgi:hypothetical protein
MLGAIRQELLTGIRNVDAFDRLRTYLGWFPDERTTTDDRERAASFANDLRRRGVQASHVDALICAVAARLGSEVLTNDPDFVSYAGVLPVILYRPPGVM